MGNRDDPTFQTIERARSQLVLTVVAVCEPPSILRLNDAGRDNPAVRIATQTHTHAASKLTPDGIAASE